jgi:hypothetical protein
LVTLCHSFERKLFLSFSLSILKITDKICWIVEFNTQKHILSMLYTEYEWNRNKENEMSEMKWDRSIWSEEVALKNPTRQHHQILLHLFHRQYDV